MTATPRVGMGVDAHRFAAGRPLHLGGVLIPGCDGLEGHSDGDAALHALCDAVLGAAGAGDLGAHFPPSDGRWRGADSLHLLERCLAIATAAGLRLASAHVVVVAERPRLAAHVAAMEAAIAAVPGAGGGAVRIAATTTDGMGFTGRGEGIAATAVALLVPAE